MSARLVPEVGELHVELQLVRFLPEEGNGGLQVVLVLARHPELIPLPPDTVRAALGRPQRPVSSARDMARADATPASAPSAERDGPGARSEPDSQPERIEPPAEAGGLAEAKLDRLLQSFLR